MNVIEPILKIFDFIKVDFKIDFIIKAQAVFLYLYAEIFLTRAFYNFQHIFSFERKIHFGNFFGRQF